MTISTIPHLGLPLCCRWSRLLSVFWPICNWRGQGVYGQAAGALGPGQIALSMGLISGLVRFFRCGHPLRTAGAHGCLCHHDLPRAGAHMLVPPFIYGELPAMPAFPHGVMLHEWAFIVIALIGVFAGCAPETGSRPSSRLGPRFCGGGSLPAVWRTGSRRLRSSWSKRCPSTFWRWS